MLQAIDPDVDKHAQITEITMSDFVADLSIALVIGHRALLVELIKNSGRRGGSVVSMSTWDLKVESLSPGRCTHDVFVGKTLNSGV